MPKKVLFVNSRHARHAFAFHFKFIHTHPRPRLHSTLVAPGHAHDFFGFWPPPPPTTTTPHLRDAFASRWLRCITLFYAQIQQYGSRVIAHKFSTFKWVRWSSSIHMHLIDVSGSYILGDATDVYKNTQDVCNVLKKWLFPQVQHLEHSRSHFWHSRKEVFL